ncbi:tRNA (guanine-N(7)-)-methyltransferase (tRNA(m7G46)-methyltransferase) [Microbotryomycetes sp. JL221]|nr:tRNA (guanine-N(7)-)-methyltransferase (tRNA(m7G46)-methyltransferase) [Microbotryomycetes sp. JL221]
MPRSSSRRVPHLSQIELTEILKPLSFTSKAAWSVVETRASWERSAPNQSFEWASPELNQALGTMLQLVMRDFVLRWYTSISDSPSFPTAVEDTIRAAVTSLAGRLDHIDWTVVMVDKILPIITDHIDCFRTAEKTLRGGQHTANKAHLTESDELDLFLAKQYASATPKHALHPSVDIASQNSKPSEEAWLREVIERVLPHVLPAKELESPVVTVVVREIMSCSIMAPMVESFSDPDLWNRIIDDKAGSAIRDKRMVDQFRQALNRQGTALSQLPLSIIPNGVSKSSRIPKTAEISVVTNSKVLKSWFRDISKVKTLAEARRLRSDITTQIRKTRLRIGQCDPLELVDGVAVRDWSTFVDRLYVARQMAEKRIAELGGPQTNSQGIGLKDILAQPGPLSYFMEFQERRKRSQPLQFWLLVEGMKDPLEQQDALALLKPEKPSNRSAESVKAVEAFRDDVHLVWDAYLSKNVVKVQPRYVGLVKSFVDRKFREIPSLEEVASVKRAIFAAQDDVLSGMIEDDYTAFQQSNLWINTLAEMQSHASGTSAMLQPSIANATPVRPRSSSNPLRTPTVSAPLRGADSPTSPLLSTATNSKQPLARTDTAPPQLTLKSAFDETRPSNRRIGSDSHLTDRVSTSPGRKVSGGSFDDLSASISSLPESTTSSKRQATTALSDSLDFLMTSPRDQRDAAPPLFQEDDEEQRPPYRAEGTQLDDEEYVQVHTIEAIQEALSTILAMDGKATGDVDIGQDRLQKTAAAEAATSSEIVEASTVEHMTATSQTSSKPVTRRGMFDDDDFDETLGQGTSDQDDFFDPQSIRLAAPGDLDLADEIARLTTEIDRLEHQTAVVEAMIRKAELTGNGGELKILIKSRDSLRREMRAMTFQRTQYEGQESQSKLTPGKTHVTIPGTSVGQAKGQSFQLYLVEVHQLQADNAFGSGWIVTRRYSEFASLHSILRDRYPASVKQLDFPSKRLVTSYSKDFVEARRRGLERYLQNLVKDSNVCHSSELRTFMSQQNITLPRLDNVSFEPTYSASTKSMANLFPGQNLVRSMTSGIDDIVGSSASSIVDMVINRLSTQTAVADEDLVAQVTTGPRRVEDGADLVIANGVVNEALTHFTAPICDLAITLFNLKDSNQWLRRQAIVIILQQVLGGTIERKLREGFSLLSGQAQLATYIDQVRSNMWPDGEMKQKEPPRTAEQLAVTREAAYQKLMALMPDVAANFIGRSNAKQGTRQLFAMIQNRRLNKHLIYTILEEVLAVVFPEIKQSFKTE